MAKPAGERVALTVPAQSVENLATPVRTTVEVCRGVTGCLPDVHFLSLFLPNNLRSVQVSATSQALGKLNSNPYWNCDGSKPRGGDPIPHSRHGVQKGHVIQ